LGVTLKLDVDGKLHLYRTGTTTDVVPPHALAKVTEVSVTGGSTSDVLTIDSMGTGAVNLTINTATGEIAKDNAISAGTTVTVDGGVLDFNGHAVPLEHLVIKNNGQVTGNAIVNTSTTVTSGTLTATSIVCDTLTIGTDANAGATASASPTIVAKIEVTEDTVEISRETVVASCAETGNDAAQIVAETPLEEQSPAIEVALPSIQAETVVDDGAVLESSHEPLPAAREHENLRSETIAANFVSLLPIQRAETRPIVAKVDMAVFNVPAITPNHAAARGPWQIHRAALLSYVRDMQAENSLKLSEPEKIDTPHAERLSAAFDDLWETILRRDIV
jgi:hypothetical protein